MEPIELGGCDVRRHRIADDRMGESKAIAGCGDRDPYELGRGEMQIVLRETRESAQVRAGRVVAEDD
jgi:hypothetical protein